MEMRRSFQVFLYALALCAVSFQGVMAQPDPEITTGLQKRASATGTRFMAVTAHPDATRVAYEVLKAGGGAVDAAVAAQTVLGLVEPQSSGLGGGGFVLYYNASTQKLFAFDGRETAPSSAGKYLFMDAEGKPMEFFKAAVGGRAVGVPGTVRLMEALHKKFGRLPWRDLFSPAITMATQGFQVSPRLAAMVDNDADRLTTFSATRLYFFPDAITPVQPGAFLKNVPYAQTLKKIAMVGADVFYKGEIAQDIVKIVQEAPGNPGLLSVEDMANYKIEERKPICGAYRGYSICSVGEPSSGGLTILSALGMLNNFKMPGKDWKDPKAWHLIGEASRLAFADRNYYMADPQFAMTPGVRLIDPGYLKTRAALIDPAKTAPEVTQGTPAGWDVKKQSPDFSFQPPGTTHLSIVDAAGNILSMTSSIENSFGSRLMADGFLLNNQLTDFSFNPEINGKAVANRVEGGKRPRSSMAPIIVFDHTGKPVMVIGSAGGSAIIGYVLERIIALIDWRMDIEDALAMPNIINRGQGFEMEAEAYELEDGIKAYGHPYTITPLNSGLTAITFQNGKMTGAADPRREGMAMGE